MLYEKNSHTRLYIPFTTDLVEQVNNVTIESQGTVNYISDKESGNSKFAACAGLIFQRYATTPVTIGNEDYCIEFGIKLTGGNADWDNMFAFGTHNAAGGDSTSYCIGFTSGYFRLSQYRAGSDIITDNKDYMYSTFVDKWKYIAVSRHEGTTRAFVDGTKVLEGTIPIPETVTSFYFNGSGNGGTRANSLYHFRMQVGESLYTEGFAGNVFKKQYTIYENMTTKKIHSFKE